MLTGLIPRGSVTFYVTAGERGGEKRVRKERGRKEREREEKEGGMEKREGEKQRE